ncbi:MAG: ribbon-helix-helix protein, CopG family [Dehalococcoidia bacterium]|nr:ribbon-helix-helix protein, CopG family [Dehalococcoidia bacterium]
MMKRTTISLPEELLRRLRMLAAERGTSMAALIREAVEDKAGPAAAQPRPKPTLAIFASAKGDLSRRSADERAVPRAWR